MYNKIKAWLFRAALLMVALLGTVQRSRATGGETDVSDFTTSLSDMTTLFLSIAGLAVVVTGFFLGRKWFRKI